MKTIAVSGKGGTGKTTLAALIIRWLGRNVTGSILAVDADSNVNLNDVLGVQVRETIGAIREEMKAFSDRLPGGMTKLQFLEYKIHASLVETPHFDLIAMGRPEGPGCYCYANNLLREILGTLQTNYEYVVIDNEAGMEHLSRRTTQRIDVFLVVSDASVRGIRAAGKITRLLEEVRTRTEARHLVVNRVREALSGPVREAIREENLDLVALIPEDDALLRADQDGQGLGSLPDDSAASKAVHELMTHVLKVRPQGDDR